ncbi:MAG: DUF6259 domain-containing protein [Armatimonadia bacterium]
MMTHHRWLYLIALLLPVAVFAGQRQDFALDGLRLVGCRIDAGRVVLDRAFDQADAPAIAMEAEQAVDLIANPAQGQADEACSGGRCVVRVDRALFPVRVTRPGRYVRWVRGYFPQGGGWVHSESLDFGAPQWYTDCDGSTAGKWVWVKGPVYDLAAGVHLLWLHNWHGGALLDKIALMPEGIAPSDMGPASTPLAPAKEGWAATRVVAIPGLTALTAADWPGEANGGQVTRRISLDGGRTWEPLAPRAGLNEPVAQVALRADLQAANGRGPALSAPTLSYETSPQALVTLENDRVRATFLKATGALVGLYDKGAKADCLNAPGLEAPFALRHLPTGAAKPETIPADQVKLTGLKVEKTGLFATYLVASDIRVRLQVGLKGDELTFGLDVDNASKLDLVEVACPFLPGVRMGERSADDLLMTPSWQGGVETSDPVRIGEGGVRYPTGGAMCWFDLYEKQPAHGIYLSGHDTSLMGCYLSATPDREADTLTFSLTKYAHVKPGKRFTTAPAVIGVHQGDWHTAADAYRTWAQTWMRKPNPPEWVREADGWYGLVTSADSSKIPFRRMPEYLKRARELGTNYIQVWGQMTGGNNCDSLPYPNPVLGGLDEFKASVREVRRWGGHITFYVSSQFWKVDYGNEPMIGSTPRSLLPAGVPTWDWTEWINYAIRGYDGGFSGDTPLSPEEKARYVTNWRRTILCPMTDAWANRHLKYWCVDQYGGQYGASGIYLDETCAAAERYCFAANHGHEHHGVWGAGLTKSMRDMVESGRKRDPDWMFAMEGCGDAVGQFADVNLISPASARKPGQWGVTRRFAPECFHYTFPDYILYDGVANGTYGKSQEDCFLDVHLHGNRYDSFSVAAADYLKLRQRTKQLLYRARFMDSVGVETADEPVRAKLNVLDDIRLINLANPEHKPAAQVTVAVEKPAGYSAYYFDLEGKEGPLPVQVQGNRVTFTAPTSRASTVVLARRCEPLVRVPTASITAGDAGYLEVFVTNVTAQRIQGKLRLEQPLAGNNPQTNLNLPPQATIAVRLPLTATAAAERRCYAGHVILEAAGTKVRRPVELLVVSPFGLSATLKPQGVRVTVINQSQATQEGVLTLKGVPWPAGVKETLKLGPAQTAQVLLPLENAPLDTLSLDAEIQVSGQADQQRLAVRPVVINGGFERAGAGGRPADWSYQGPERVSMETKSPAEGQQCLKLEGQKGVFVEADQTIAVEPGGTYEATCRMHRTAGEGARIGPAVVLFLKAGGERYVYMQKTTKAPDDQWNEYRGTFTVKDDVARVLLYLYNVNSTATAWYDDVRVRPVSGE